MRFCSIFSQLLQFFPRSQFHKAVQETNAQRHARGFDCWDQFVAMLFCQLAQAQSLREVCWGLASYKGKLCHLGLNRAPARSTLAYANEHRAVQLYETVFYQLLARCQQAVQHQGQGAKLRFKNKLLSIDASTIELCASVFDWAKFRRTKGAVKLHLVLQHQGYLPHFALISEGCKHEVTVARTLSFAAGTILVVDRGYTDYQWFCDLTVRGIYFVTRLKDNAAYEVVEERVVPQNRQVRADQVIRLSGTLTSKKCPHLLRRTEVYDPQTSADRQDIGLFDQSSEVWSHHHRGHLQGALANRVVLQGTQAELEDQNLCRHQCQCAQDSGVGSADCDVAAALPATQKSSGLGFFPSGGATASQSHDLLQSVAVVGSSL